MVKEKEQEHIEVRVPEPSPVVGPSLLALDSFDQVDYSLFEKKNIE